MKIRCFVDVDFSAPEIEKTLTPEERETFHDFCDVIASMVDIVNRAPKILHLDTNGKIDYITKVINGLKDNSDTAAKIPSEALTVGMVFIGEEAAEKSPGEPGWQATDDPKISLESDEDKK